MKNQKRATTLKKLAEEYYSLAVGYIIERPDELLRVVDVKETQHQKHPHKKFRVYISRKSLKHFVESRKEELRKRHTFAEAVVKILFAIEQISEVFLNFDKYEYEPEKHFYIKHYSGEPSLRIFVEEKNINSLEICSIHFTKHKK